MPPDVEGLLELLEPPPPLEEPIEDSLYTVTSQVAVMALLVSAVMIVVPSETPITTPVLSSTVAMLTSSERHLTRLVLLGGVNKAVIFIELPMRTDAKFGLIVIDVASTGRSLSKLSRITVILYI